MNRLPNMSRTVLRFAQLITKKTVTQTVVNHQTVKTYVDTPFKATITTPLSDDLLGIEINTSLKYKVAHSIDELKMDDLFNHKGTTYKVIKLNDRSDYGYYRALGEEIQL